MTIESIEPGLTICIVLAAYNGEKYINEQLDSVLPYLTVVDELIISDDGSTDSTLEIVYNKINHILNSCSIKIINGPREGVQLNFYNAVKNVKSDIICFCDQDDIWYPGKIETIRSVFETNHNANVLLHDARLIDSDGRVVADSLLKMRSFKHGYYRNLIKSGYYGCCMAVRRQFLFCKLGGMLNSPAYDQYLGLVAEKNNTSYLINDVLIDHRIHQDNISHKLSLARKIGFRIRMFAATHNN